MKHGISLCMIVKDEEPQLSGCLESVKGLVSEIIVVDTGSTDRSKQIALENSAKVIDFKWIDDFSAARNVSLKAASYDWIIVLDADERLDVSDFDKIRKLTSRKDLVYKFVQRHYRNETELVGFNLCQGQFPGWESGWKGYVESSLVRFFPNNQQIEYRNCMHELVEDCVRDLPEYKVVETGIRLHHFDHARPRNRIEWKNQLYTKLSTKKAALMSDSWKAHFELGLDLNVKKHFAKAIEPLIKAHQLDPKQIDPLLALGHSYGELRKLKESEACFVQVLKLDPKHFQAICHLGVVYMKAQRFDLAIKCLCSAVEMKPTDIGALLNLGEVYLNSANNTEAQKIFKKVIDLVPDTPRALIGFAICSCNLGAYAEAEKALLCLKKLGSEDATVAYWMSEIYRLSGRVKEAAELLRNLIQVVQEQPLKQELIKKYQACLDPSAVSKALNNQ